MNEGGATHEGQGKDDTVTVQLTVDQVALFASCLQISRSPVMEELSERLIGSPEWKHVHRKREAHHGVTANTPSTAAYGVRLASRRRA